MEAVQEKGRVDDVSHESTAPPAQSEDLDSHSSSRSSSTVSDDDYEYDPKDFPRLNEIEEISSRSFSWGSSRSVSLNERLARPASAQYNNNWPKKLVVKLKAELEHLSVLLSLSEVDPVADFDNSTRMEVIAQAQNTIDKASDNTLKLRNKDWDDMVVELEKAATNISSSGLLVPTKLALANLIQLADLVAKTAEEVGAQYTWHRECQALKSNAEWLATLLWWAAHNDLSTGPLWFIIVRVEETLFRAAAVAKKYRNIASRIFTVVKVDSIEKMLEELEESITDVSWLLSMSKYPSPEQGDDEDHILFLIREGIARLVNSPPEIVVAAATSLLSLARDSDQYGMNIIKEGGVEPLLMAAQKRGAEEQESAIKVMGFLCRNLENAIMLTKNYSNVFSVLASVHKDGPIQVQTNAAWAISQLAAHYHDQFRFRHLAVVVEPLVNYLFDYAMCDKPDYSLDPDSIRVIGLLVDDPNLRWRAFNQNIFFQLMFHVPILMERATREVQYNIANLLLVIARKVRGDAVFRMFFFPEVHHWGSSIDQLLKIVTQAKNNERLVSRMMEVIQSLICLLDSQNKDIFLEAILAVTKLTHEYNILHEGKNPQSHGLVAIANLIVCAALQGVVGLRKNSPEVMAAAAALFKALGFLGRDLDNAKMVVRDANVYFVLVNVLKDGPIHVKANAARAVSQLAAHYSLSTGIIYRGLDKIDNAYTTLIDLLLVIVEKALGSQLFYSASDRRAHQELLLVSIEALGRLCMICMTTKVISPLVRLLDKQDDNVVLKAVLVLTEFTDEFSSPYKTKKYMYIKYCNEIAKNGTPYISQLIYQGHTTQKHALMLACMVAARVRQREELNTCIKWAYKQSHLVQDATIKSAIENLKHLDI